jgi:hypothetical protein
MANYKRKRCRYKGGNNMSSMSFYRKRHGLKPYTRKAIRALYDERGCYGYTGDIWPDEFNPMANHPRSWDIVYHSRPRRHRDKMTARAILKGADADATLWQLEHKPYVYYW